jgi:hypothetical protein
MAYKTMTTRGQVRQGIVPGEWLTKTDFCERIGIKPDGWHALKLRMESKGFCMYSRPEGSRQGFIETDVWIAYLLSQRKANAGTK